MFKRSLLILAIACMATLTPACGSDQGSSDDSSESGGRGSGGRGTGGRGSGDGGSGGTGDNTGDNNDVGEVSGLDVGLDTGGGDDTPPDSDTGGGTGGDTGGETPVEPPAPTEVGGVRGRVWAPGQAPGMVPTNQEIPVSGALVYLTTSRPSRIPDRAYCASCVAPPYRAVLSSNDGSFMLDGFEVGTWWLVMEKGQFRREVQVEITLHNMLVMEDELTTLPSRNDWENGMTIPRIALAAGQYDPLESIFGKMGMGRVDGTGRYVRDSIDGTFDVWTNGGAGWGDVALGSLGDLVSDLNKMLDYHLILIPCAGDTNVSFLKKQEVLRNIRDYVAAGGNLYVTDWSGEWNDNVFPAQIQLSGSNYDTPANGDDAATDTWNTSRFGNADGNEYDSDHAIAADPGLYAWLHGQVGPTASSSSPSTYNAGHFRVDGSWNTISNLHTVQIGTDGGGRPIYDEPRVWVTGNKESGFLGIGGDSTQRPLTVTHEPAGCGRVLFSTYHTTEGHHIGLVPQERVLLYLIMEIGTCRDMKQ